MKSDSLKLILDIESILGEIEQIKIQVNNDFLKFNSNFVLQRAVERELEIIGEAINKLSKLEPNIKISSIPKIIALRNLIVHAYDSVEPQLIWAIIQRDVPKLSEEISRLKK